MKMNDLSFSASQVAKVVGASSANVISVWTNRGLINPGNVKNLSSKKRIFEFSFLNLFQAALLKELGDYFLIQYEFLNRSKQGKLEFSEEELERAIREERGFLVVTDEAKENVAGGGSQAIKSGQGIVWELIDEHEGVSNRIAKTRYALVMNIREITQRLMSRIEKLSMEE